MNTRRLTQLALLLALSYVGSLIKIPTPIGSTAFDSAPAFLAAIELGAPGGFLVGLVGHLLTASISGFPLTVPVHLVSALGMGVVGYAFALLWPRSRWLASLVAVLLNGIGLPLMLLAWPQYNMKLIATVLMPFLLLAAFLNVLVAILVWLALRRMRGATS